VRWSPVWDYINKCWLPFLREIGFCGEIELKRAGFYPRGGGKVEVKIMPIQIMHPFKCVDRGELVRIRGISGVSNLDTSIATRQKHQALRLLYDFCRDSKIRTINLPSPSKGTFILLKAEFSKCGYACFSALGAPGKPAESVADEAVEELLGFLQTDGCVDHYMADQILLPLSIIPGKSSYRTNRITRHLLTNIYVIEKFLPVKITLEGELDAPGLVIIHGTSL
jgi:RNA 3'-terminal phosphate cyclase (ATP)